MNILGKVSTPYEWNAVTISKWRRAIDAYVNEQGIDRSVFHVVPLRMYSLGGEPVIVVRGITEPQRLRLTAVVDEETNEVEIVEVRPAYKRLGRKSHG